MPKKTAAATEATHPLLLATLCPQCLKEIELLPGIAIPTLQLADDGRFACQNGHAYDTLPEEETTAYQELPPWEIPVVEEGPAQLPELEALPPKAPPVTTVAPEAVPPLETTVVKEISFPEILAFPEINPGKRAVLTSISEVLPPEAVAFEKPRGTSAPGDDGAPRELPGGDVIFTVRVSETHVMNLRAEAEVKEMTLKGYFDAWVDYCLSTGLYF